jgi:hypothetical protein
MAEYERRPPVASDREYLGPPMRKKKKKKKVARKKTAVERVDSRDSLRSEYMRLISKPAIPRSKQA